MKKIIKNNLRFFIAILITLIISISGTVYAVTQYYANQISFTPSQENQENGFTATNVEDALNELYSENNNYKFAVNAMHNTGSGNTYVNLTSKIIINEDLVVNNNGIYTLKKDGKVNICATSKAHYAGANASKARLYINNNLIYDIVTNEVYRCDEFEVHKNDIINYQIASGNIYGLGSLTIYYIN